MEVSENLNQSLINLMNVVNNSQSELLKKDEEDNIPENYYIKTLPIEISKEVELSEYEILRLISEHTENLNTEFLKYLKQSIIDWSDNFICSYSYDLLSLLKEKNEEKTGEIESKLLEVFSDKGLSYEYKVYKIFPLMFEYLGARANRYLRKVRTEYEKGGITEYLIINIDKILEEIERDTSITADQSIKDLIAEIKESEVLVANQKLHYNEMVSQYNKTIYTLPFAFLRTTLGHSEINYL